MKKGILFLGAALAALCIAAICYQNWCHSASNQGETSLSAAVASDGVLIGSIGEGTGPDLFYGIDNRYVTSITKEKLHNAKSIIDILPTKATQSRESYQNARVSILYNDTETTEVGNGEVLNAAQLELLQSTDYSNNISVSSIGSKKNASTGELEEDSLIYYITIIPEKVAEFTGGHDALIAYLKENSKDKIAIIKEDKLQPGKVSFTVTKKGTIANVKLTSTSGYTSVDNALIDLITDMPANWQPATNSSGDKVDQELVFFFGLQGC